METTKIAIEGMTCGHCVAGVRGALEALEGVKVRDVQVGSATVEHDPARVDAAALARAIEDEGYRAAPGAA